MTCSRGLHVPATLRNQRRRSVACTGAKTGAPAGASPRPPRLSEEIGALISVFAERSVTLRQVISLLRGRAYTLLLIFLAIPFCTPIPLPGLSTPFGLVIALVGFRLALRQEPWLPRRLLNTKVPPRFFSRLLGAARRLIRGLEFILRPRWEWLLDIKLLHHGYGAIICASGLLLLIPLPLPLSNGLPALTVVLLACGLLERDGYCLLGGTLTFVLTLCFFAAILWGGAEVAGWLHERLDLLLHRQADIDS